MSDPLEDEVVRLIAERGDAFEAGWNLSAGTRTMEQAKQYYFERVAGK